jgi:hypothetical protein
MSLDPSSFTPYCATIGLSFLMLTRLPMMYSAPAFFPC